VSLGCVTKGKSEKYELREELENKDEQVCILPNHNKKY
jgi:hypothetical protein